MRGKETRTLNLSAIILAGGKGTRLYPYSNEISKPLLPLLNKPMIVHSIERIYDSGIENVGVLVGRREQKLQEILYEYFPRKNFQFFVQEKPLGTGDAVLQVERGIHTNNFLVVAGDSLFSKEFFREVSLKHLKNKYTATLALEKMPFEKMRYSSTVDFHDNRIWKIREKPKTKDEILSNLNSAACYVFTSEIFNALKHIEKSQRNEYELASAINYLINNEKVVGGLISSKVDHISNSYDLWKTNIEFLHQTKLKDTRGNMIAENISISNSAEIMNSVLGNNSVIGNNVKLENAVVLPNSVVNNSYKNALILSEHVEIFTDD